MIVSPPTCQTRPVFFQSCEFSCVGEGFRIDPPWSIYVYCIGRGRWTGQPDSIQCIGEKCPETAQSISDQGSTPCSYEAHNFTKLKNMLRSNHRSPAKCL